MPTSSMLTPASAAAVNSRASSPGRSLMTTCTAVNARAGPPRLPGIRATPARPCSSSRARSLPASGAGAPGDPLSVIPARIARGLREAGGHRGQDRRDGSGVPGQDLRPQVHVTHGDPGGVAQALPGQASASGGTDPGPAARPWPRRPRAGRARRARPSGRGVPASVTTGSAPHAVTIAVTAATAAPDVSGAGHSAQARPRKRSARAAAGPDRSRPASGCPGTYREMSQPASRARASGSAFTLATSVYQWARPARCAAGQHGGHLGRRHGDQRQVAGPRSPAASRPSRPSRVSRTCPAPRSAASAAAAGSTIPEPDAGATAPQGKRR